MLQASWDVMLKLSPWLLFGALVAALLHGALPKGLVRRQFHGPLGVLKAVALGIPLPLCSCGVIPAALGLKKDGASDGSAIGFLISTPQTGFDSILVSASFLGWPFALFKVVSAGVMGLAGGWIAEGASPSAPAAPAVETIESDNSRPGLRGMWEHGLQLIRSVWHWLAFGILASAALETLVPSEVWTEMTAYGSALTFAAVLGLSLPLYVCATASVPIAAALVAGGFPPGAALVFLMAGPASNVATMGTVYRGFGGRALAIYLSTITVGSLAAGLLFDAVLPQAQTMSGHLHEGGAWWEVVGAVILTTMLTYFAIADAQKWIKDRFTSRQHNFAVGVEGMTCGNCVRKLEKALNEVPGVDSASVQLKPGEARVSGAFDQARITEVIRSFGFTITAAPSSEA